MTDINYQKSRPLDAQGWSEHREANVFVDYVYYTYLNTQSNENQRIKKRHLKVVLLDMYVVWLNDPELNIAVKSRFETLESESFENFYKRLDELGRENWRLEKIGYTILSE